MSGILSNAADDRTATAGCGITFLRTTIDDY